MGTGCPAINVLCIVEVIYFTPAFRVFDNELISALIGGIQKLKKSPIYGEETRSPFLSPDTKAIQTIGNGSQVPDSTRIVTDSGDK